MTQPEQSPDKRILVGMSGGVDSAVASWLLQSAGFHVVGAYLITHDAAEHSLADAKKLSEQLGIAFITIDVREQFQRLVIDPFVDAWLAGYTPNPCIICNPMLKFTALLQEADKNHCDFIATGHYAAIDSVEQTGRLALKNMTEGRKDQTYFLYRLTQEQLQRIRFPLAGFSKETVRSIAAENNLIDRTGKQMSDKPDSQDICFVPDKNYVALIRTEAQRRFLSNADRLLKPGSIKNTNGQIIGTHPGLIHYTFGQRKGFDVQTTDRLFVIDRNLDDRSLVVGNYEHVKRKAIRVTNVVYSGARSFANGEQVSARVRSSAQNAPCRVFPVDGDNNALSVVFDDSVAAPTPGQSCVFYRNQTILAGGLIDHNGVITT